MDRKQLDELFDDAFEEAVRSELEIEIPDPDASWNKMAGLIAKQACKRRLRKCLQLVAMIAAAMLLGVVIFSKPRETEAFLPVTKFISGVKDGVVTMFQGDKKKLEEDPPKGMLTAPPPEGNVGSVMGQSAEDYTVASRVQAQNFEEAKKATPTLLPTVGYVPEGYELMQIELQLNSMKKLVKGLFNYKTKQGEGWFTLNVVPIPMNLGNNAQRNCESDNLVQSEKVKIGTADGVWIPITENSFSLLWSNPTNKYVIQGALDKAGMIKVAEGIK